MTYLQRRSIRLLLALLCLFIVPSGAAAQEADWTLSYVVRPSLDQRTLSVTAVLVGDVSEGVLWRRYGPGDARTERGRPQAQDAFGQTLRVTAHPQGWSVDGAGASGMRVTYSVDAPGSRPVGTAGVGIGPEALYAPGYELFLVPEDATRGTAGGEGGGRGIGSMEVIFDIPVSWRAVVPWDGYSRTYRPMPPSSMWNSLVAAGDFRRHIVRVAGMEIQVGIQGLRPGTDSTLLEVVRRVVLAGQEVFGQPVRPTMTLLLPDCAPGGEVATHLGASVAVARQQSGASAGDIDDLHRLTRELLGIWDGGGGSEPAWFAHGVRDYTAWLILLRQGLIQPDTFRQQMLQAERAYLAHPHASDWSFAQEAARTPEALPEGVAGLATSRGLVVALALDAAIARVSAGRSRLMDLLRTVYAARRDPESQGGVRPLRESDLMRAAAAISGGDYLDSLFQSLVFGTARPPTVEALADILERERRRP